MAKLDVDQLRSVDSLDSLIEFLRDQLDWPIQDYEPEDLTFEWSSDSLHIGPQHSGALSGGQVRQLRNMTSRQPWGVFLVEFNDDRIHAGLLRQILRGLVANQRHDPHLPAWQHDNLLFICASTEYARITFVHFRGEKMQKSRLSMFGWQRDNAYLRTLCEFNLPCLRWPEDTDNTDGWLKTWTAAFDKEPLTRDFFKRFERALEAVKDDLQALQQLSSAEAYSKAQLLLERLLFLYFLQNRGWLNRQRKFLREGFEAHRSRPDECTYYAEFLERLFFTLANPPGTLPLYQMDGIPFLNGGLFNDDEFPSPSSKTRKDFPPLLVRNSTFDFVFSNLLEQFNFTVREDTPLDQDVAVDPEMLGKVFETIVLHADASTDYNAPDKRKGTGSYYTPRIVVHFICREALRLYMNGRLPGSDWEARIRTLFEIDPTLGLEASELDHLKNTFKAADGRQVLDIVNHIKMCDPAVGSGAFPVGLLHELVNIRRVAETVANGFVDPVRRQGTNWTHETKADVVENCLYGVDIQQQAIEICRLRLWLSLIVDYDLGLDPFEADPVQFQQAIQRISQLPNLEMNFRRGDSLLDYICGINVRVAPEKSERYEKEFSRIHELGVRLHHEKKSGNKRELRIEILRKRLDLSERVLTDEVKAIADANSQLTLSIVSENGSESAKRQQVAQEMGRLRQALEKVAGDRKAVEKIASRPYDMRFYAELRKLEGADFDSPFNFSWRIDFADVFQGVGGFDLILGNPPFVTARNPEKRELYRERWKRVCSGKYLLVCPFFDLSFGLLRPGGQLGFIVSNAFAKREFGKPLVEDFFPTVDLQKIVDCSGLMFPGHGTPTWLLFGRSQSPTENDSIRVAATLPGGGDLRTMPEESLLWRTLEAHHDTLGYVDERITVAERTRDEMAKWPWNLDAGPEPTRHLLEKHQAKLNDFLVGNIGYGCVTRADDIYFAPPHLFRRVLQNRNAILPLTVGDHVRNWTLVGGDAALFPYSPEFEPSADDAVVEFLSPFKNHLEGRVAYGKTQVQRGLKWFEYSMLFSERLKLRPVLCFADIATHCHFVIAEEKRIFKDTAPIFSAANAESSYMLAGLINASAVLFWLKQLCFSKRESEEGAKDTYFEFLTAKVEALPIPSAAAEGFRGKSNEVMDKLQALSLACSQRGRQLPALAMKKVFEKPGEAYQDWNSSLPGYVAPDQRIDQPFVTSGDLGNAFNRTCEIRERLRNEMIALQEEMDWLAYAAYELIPSASPALGRSSIPAPLQREQRPFVLWSEAGEDFSKAVSLIPPEWAQERKTLWQERLKAINENEHIRRIEQPVYKRRWDEQWKVGARWQCGPMAYDAEFLDAFDWWLSEKAECWLEKERNGGPVSLQEWTAALFQDERVQAAWQVAREVMARQGRREDFARHLSVLVKEQSVPENIPIAVPWDDIEMKVPASVKRIRGKLNVPRERFRIAEAGGYVWAGKK